MTIEQKKIDFLKSIEADDKSHSGISLIDHLIGVHDILKDWGAPQYIQDAGLFHSVYGTSKFHHESTNDRNKIKDLIGSQAEELVWQFCIEEEDIYKLEKQMISDLMLLHKANNVEQSERTKAPMMSWKEAYDL